MVDIIKPETSWNITLVFNNRECPYLIYPANYHGCKHPKMKYADGTILNCDGSICPIITSKQEETL